MKSMDVVVQQVVNSCCYCYDLVFSVTKLPLTVFCVCVCVHIFVIVKAVVVVAVVAVTYSFVGYIFRWQLANAQKKINLKKNGYKYKT